MNWQPMLGYFDGSIDLSQASLYESALREEGTTALPAFAYRSKAFADLEDEKVWTRAWSCIGYSARIPRPGDLYPFTVGQHGVHVQRQPNGSLKAHFNFSQHGGCRFVPRQCQTGKKTDCFYTSCGHSRDRDVLPANYDGSETSEMYMYRGINPLKLIPIGVAELGPLLFVNLDADCPSLDAQLGDDQASLIQAFSSSAEHRNRHRLELSCNWKLAGRLLLESASTIGEAGAWLYPNLLVMHARARVITVILQPTALDGTLAIFDVFGSAEAPDALDTSGALSRLEEATASARKLQRDCAGAGDPSPFLPQVHIDRPLALEDNATVRTFNRRLVADLMVRHRYVERPLYSQPGRSLNAGINSGAF